MHLEQFAATTASKTSQFISSNIFYQATTSPHYNLQQFGNSFNLPGTTITGVCRTNKSITTNRCDSVGLSKTQTHQQTQQNQHQCEHLEL